MKLYPNSYLTFAKIFDEFITSRKQVIPCSLQNGTNEIIFQIECYSVHANASYNGLFHTQGYVEREYIDSGGIYYFIKHPMFKIERYRRKKRRVAIGIKQGTCTCIVFENNGVNSGLKTMTDENKDGIGDKRGVLTCFLQTVKINSTNDAINFGNATTNFYTSEKLVSYRIRECNIILIKVLLQMKKILNQEINLEKKDRYKSNKERKELSISRY